jgi:arylsulfatase A-like enzyme
LRADHLGHYGYAFDTSPNLDRLANDALLFDDAMCEVPLTGPSMASMFSSRYPRITGATRNALPLPDDVPTAAEAFDGAGYHTIAVLSNWTLKRKLSGLQRGFDVYDDDFHKKRWGFIKAERDAEDVTGIALKLIEERDASRPLFAWIHYSDPHAPYQLHRRFDVANDVEHEERRVERVTRRYDSEIAYMDHHIGRLLEALPAENTYIVFVADHGESLWEHDYLGHGRRVYQPGMHIPFFVQGPGIEPGRSQAPVRGVDIGVTLLGLGGLKPAEGMLGVDAVTSPPAADRVRVVETYGGAVPGIPGLKAVMAGAGPERIAAIDHGWKLILGAHWPELFDLANDPEELHNLAERDEERVAALTALIRAWDESVDAIEGKGADLSESDRDALEALGYIE